MGGMQKTCSFCNGDGWVEIIDIIKKAECAENGKAEVVYGNKKKGRQDLR
jgi:hypothetical protein